LVMLWGVMIASAAEAGQQAVVAVREAGGCARRASSCVGRGHSGGRMQQGRHRKMTQELLDLKRLYWNQRPLRTGRRTKTNPYERLGVPLPPELSWWQLLQFPPDQLRLLLSAHQTAA